MLGIRVNSKLIEVNRNLSVAICGLAGSPYINTMY